MSAGRYTVVFTGLFDLKKPGEYPYLILDEHSVEDENYELYRGQPPYRELGGEISFQDLPESCRTLVLDVYASLWGL